MATPAQRFTAGTQPSATKRSTLQSSPTAERSGDKWVGRKITSNGVVSVDWQQICVGASWSGTPCDA